MVGDLLAAADWWYQLMERMIPCVRICCAVLSLRRETFFIF
jgi:hypothetical protein